MYSLATVRTLFSALRSELCSIGTGVTEKVTKTFHSFLGSSSPIDSGVRKPVGAARTKMQNGPEGVNDLFRTLFLMMNLYN